MANAFTDTSSNSLGGTVGAAGLVQKAYDRLLEFALRSEPLLRSVADKRPARQAIPGSTVVLQRYVDLDAKTSTLTETTDPDAVALTTPTQVVITLNEYGNAVLVTRALELFSLADVDPAIANIIAYNLADSIDQVVSTTLSGGTNAIYSGSATSTATIAAASTIDSADIRKAVAKLRANKAKARRGSYYWCGIHPEVSHDLRAESGNLGWNFAHINSDPAVNNVWAGEIGDYEGAFFVESSRLPNEKAGADQSALSTSPAVSGVSGAFTIVVANGAFGGRAEVGDKISGTNVGASAKITAISVGETNTTLTVSVANSGTVGTNTLTVTPVTRVFDTILCGQQALAEAVAEEPHIVIGNVTDKLMRFRPMGWYGVLGFARYREEALYRIESGSSIAALQLIDSAGQAYQNSLPFGVSSLGGLMTEYIFTTPVVEEGPAGSGRLFHFYKLNRGISIVLKPTGGYEQVRYLQDSDFDSYPAYYQGGYNYTVDEATKAALIAGGVGVTESNFTAI